MALTYQSTAAVATSTTGNLTLTLPTGHQQGDLLVACISARGTPTITPPTDWIELSNQNSGNSSTTTASSIASGRVYYIVRGSSAPGNVFTVSSGDVQMGRIMLFRPGAGETVVIEEITEGTLASNGTAAHTFSSRTIDQGENLVQAGFGADNGTWSATSVSTSGSVTNTAIITDSTTSGSDTALGIKHWAGGSGGGTVTATLTHSASSRHAFAVFRAYAEAVTAVDRTASNSTTSTNAAARTIEAVTAVDRTASNSTTSTNAAARTIEGSTPVERTATNSTTSTNAAARTVENYTLNLSYTSKGTVNNSSGSSGSYTHTLFSITSVTDRYYILYLSVGVINGAPTTAEPNNTIGITWTKVGTSSNTSLNTYFGKCTSGSTGNITVSVTGAPASVDFSGGVVEVWDSTGATLGILQSSSFVYDTTSPLSGVSLSTFANTAHHTLLHFAALGGFSTTTGWTQASETNLFNGDQHRLLYKTSPDTSPSITWSGGTGVIALAYELGVDPSTPRTASNSNTSTNAAARTINFARTASNNNTSTNAAARQIANLRTADNSTTSTHAAAVTLETAPTSVDRTASNSTTTTNAAANTLNFARTASNSNTSTNNAARTINFARTASNNNTSTNAAVTVLGATRTATNSTASTNAAAATVENQSATAVERTVSNSTTSTHTAARTIEAVTAVDRTASNSTASTITATAVVEVEVVKQPVSGADDARQHPLVFKPQPLPEPTPVKEEEIAAPIQEAQPAPDTKLPTLELPAPFLSAEELAELRALVDLEMARQAELERFRLEQLRSEEEEYIVVLLAAHYARKRRKFLGINK